MDKHCHLIHTHIKNDYINPWITNKLKNAIKKKNKLFSFYKKHKCQISLMKYIFLYIKK